MTKKHIALYTAACAGWLLFGAAVAFYLVGSPDYGTKLRRECEAVARELGLLPLPPQPPPPWALDKPASAEQEKERAEWESRARRATAYVNGCISIRARAR